MMKFVSSALIVLITASATAQTTVSSVTAEQPAGAPKLEGFKLQEIRFDESTGEKKPTPVIPKSWRLVAVSNGEKGNNNNLWFQDAQGNIYLVQGFTDARQFIIDPVIQKLNVEQAAQAGLPNDNAQAQAVGKDGAAVNPSNDTAVKSSHLHH